MTADAGQQGSINLQGGQGELLQEDGSGGG